MMSAYYGSNVSTSAVFPFILSQIEAGSARPIGFPVACWPCSLAGRARATRPMPAWKRCALALLTGGALAFRKWEAGTAGGLQTRLVLRGGRGSLAYSEGYVERHFGPAVACGACVGVAMPLRGIHLQAPEAYVGSYVGLGDGPVTAGLECGCSESGPYLSLFVAAEK